MERCLWTVCTGDDDDMVLLLIIIIVVFIKGHATVSVETRAVMDQMLTTASTVSISAWAA